MGEAYLADALEDVDGLLEIANVKDWELECDVAKVAGTAFQRLQTCLATLSFVAHALYL